MSDKPRNDANEMDENFGPTFYSLTSEDGDEVTLEYLDTFEYKGQCYIAFLPTVPEDEEPDFMDEEEDYGLILMRVIVENGEELLTTLDSDEEIEEVYQYYVENFFDDEEEEE
ncbi:MAG: DUF1292 domain-containing protein [Clostridiales bacterium]|nr:DUF1292 domain-containing protein [Clostridiales bacterium]